MDETGTRLAAGRTGGNGQYDPENAKRCAAYMPERSGPKGGIVMSERNTERKEKDWTDEIPDEEDSLPEPYEETYRDGSAKNECWGEE